MEIKTPRTFKTSDKAHAELFNDMVKVILENDTRLLDQINQHKMTRHLMHPKQKSRNGINPSSIK